MANLLITTTRSQDLQPLAAAGQTGIEAWSALRTLYQISLIKTYVPSHAVRQT